MKILPAAEFSPHFWQTKKKKHCSRQVAQILKVVKKDKDKALFELTKKQTAITISSLLVPPQAMKNALRALGTEQQALTIISKNIADYHQKTKPQNWIETKNGKTWGQTYSAIEKVGVYIPGGLAAYPSSVLMNIIPAKIAGVTNIQVTSPPTETGLPHSNILATLEFLGIKKVFSVGGAQAIAALAYGTESIEQVHLITGPGNQFVAEAKKQLFGQVGIDAIAGPSEIVIFLDKNEQISSEWVAQDLIAQAEHSPDSKALLITSEKEKAEQIATIVQKLVKKSPHRKILESALSDYGFIVLTKDRKEAIKIINDLAPEHLQIFSQKKEILTSIKNVGAIFWGDYSPVAMGDYGAGPNHTLPTGASAKFFSALSVSNFMKSSSYLEYSQKGFQKEAPAALVLAKMEEQIEHSNSIKYRQK